MAKLTSEIFRYGTILFDNSVSSVSYSVGITRALYNGVSGLDNLTEEALDREEVRGSQLVKLGRKQQIIAISETVEELEKFLEIIHNQLNSVKLHEYSNRRKSKKGKRKENRLDTQWELDVSNKERSDKITRITRIANNKFRLLQKLKGTDPREDFDTERYNSYLENILDLKTKIDSEENIESYGDLFKNYLDNHNYLGERLCTDEKIIATAYAMAKETSTLIMTRDRKLIYLAQKFGFKHRSQIEANHPIASFNPELRDESKALQEIYDPKRIIMPEAPTYSKMENELTLELGKAITANDSQT